MRSLFAAILAISASTSVLPATASSINEPSSRDSAKHLSTLSTPLKVKGNDQYTFAQRSVNISKQIPNDTIGIVFLNLDRSAWKDLEQVQLNAQNPILAIDKLLAFLGKPSQFSIANDVQPWLGSEIAIAFLANTDNKTDISFAALSPVIDDRKFELFIRKLKKLELPKPTETLYQNIKILEWQLEETDDLKPEIPKKQTVSRDMRSLARIKQSQTSNANKLAQKKDADPNSEELDRIQPNFSAFSLKRFVIAKLPSGIAVIATDRQAIQKMIDLSVIDAQGQMSSLADNQLFLRSLNNPLWNRSLLAGYGDYKKLGQISELLAADLPETSEIPGFSRDEYLQGLKYTLSQYSSFDLFTWITPKGVRSQSSSYFSEIRSPQPKDTKSRDRLLSYLPSKIYGSITSRDLNRQWQWFVEESKQQPSYKIFVEGLRMLAPLIAGSGLDIDIEKDIISWIDGEYSVVVFPSDRSPFKEIGVDLTIGSLIRTSKPEAANAVLDKLTKYATSFGKDFIQVKKRQVGTTLMTSLEFPDARERGKTQSIFAYGWRDRQTLILTLGASTASAFIPIPKPSLAESEDFREAIADMPQPNFGYFYLNVNAIAKLGANFFLSELIPSPDLPPNSDSPNTLSKPKLPEPVQKFINQLGGAVFVYSETNDRFQSDAFLGLKP
ncbi:MAG: hypothetical protein DCF19_01145 [Pseudanabaena frigida]|uniref:DUF3352 domain-containing protein n=1 Tax=Pseudanabaena frigida TaxID=945775 RepID=A0A2W4WPL1_9CYAN|nr:MAG: hypothetical protein DCF19_01145 [Pseudanabaena frigida]